MNKLTVSDLYTLEEYAKRRLHFRSQVMAEKKRRMLALGANLRLYFESRLTMHYQVQEMLRIERIFEPDGILEELETYNPLIPDGDNLKATMMLQYDDPEVRKAELARLVGIENRTWMRVEGFDAIRPICDEDLERDTADKTSSVHFMRFEYPPAQIEALRAGAVWSAGVSHANYAAECRPLAAELREALLADFD